MVHILPCSTAERHRSCDTYSCISPQSEGAQGAGQCAPLFLWQAPQQTVLEGVEVRQLGIHFGDSFRGQGHQDRTAVAVVVAVVIVVVIWRAIRRD